MKKKMIAGLLACTLVVTMTVGGTTAFASESSEKELSVLVEFDPETGGQLKLDCLDEAAEKLGYKLNVERVDDETYKTKIRVMLQANELPDVFYTWGGSYSTPFLESDVLHPLEDAVKDSGYVLDTVYTQTDADGHYYTVPTGVLESYCLFYNKDVLESLGKEVPTNWDELLDVINVCNEKGIGALGLGNKDRWEGDLLYNMLVEREDADAFKNAVSGNGAFTDEAFLNAAKKVDTLIEMNAFQSGYMQATQSECTELLQSGKIAMYPTGSWQLTTFKDNPSIGVAVFPKTGDEDPYLSCCGNASDSGMAVNANSDKADEAAAFVVEYSKILNDHLAEAGEQTYFETDIEPGEEQPEIAKIYLDNFAKMEKSQLWWYTYLDTSVGEPMRDLSQEQFAGEIRAEDFVEELQSTINE